MGTSRRKSKQRLKKNKRKVRVLNSMLLNSLKGSRDKIVNTPASKEFDLEQARLLHQTLILATKVLAECVESCEASATSIEAEVYSALSSVA